MCFTFIWPGWGGTTHDSRILWEALHRPQLKFPHPPEGNYLFTIHSLIDILYKVYDCENVNL